MSRRKHRPSTERMVEDGRWIKKGGRTRFVIDTVSEVAYCARRHEPRGWFRGARVTTK